MADPEKIYPATPHKRNESRKRGQVARSQDLSAVFNLIGVLMFFYLTKYTVWDQMASVYSVAFKAIPLVDQNPIISFLSVMRILGSIITPILLLGLIFGVLGNVLQVGVMFSTEALIPKFDKLNPINGLKRLVSIRGLVELAKSVFKLSVITYVVTSVLIDNYPTLLALGKAGMSHTKSVSLVVATAGGIAFEIMLKVALILLILAILDYLYQKWQHEQDIRMTKEEMREEMKRTEGDPEIRRRIRSVQRELSMARMMKEVPEADAVITNPTHIAIAIKYEYETMEAPYVVAKGERQVALKIREIAMENGIPTIENPALARALYKNAEVGEVIPMEFYQAVAEVLAYVDELTQRFSDLSAA